MLDQNTEKILWEGSQNIESGHKKRSIWGGIFRVMVWIDNLRIIGIVAIIIYVAIFSYSSIRALYLNIFCVIIILTLVILSQYIEHKKRIETRYTISDKQISFFTWSIFKGTQTLHIDFSQIQSTSLQTFENGVGTIYLHGPDLRKHKNTEHYLALNHILEAVKVNELILDLLSSNK